jgi:hypothetical protein
MRLTLIVLFVLILGISTDHEAGQWKRQQFLQSSVGVEPAIMKAVVRNRLARVSCPHLGNTTFASNFTDAKTLPHIFVLPHISRHSNIVV